MRYDPTEVANVLSVQWLRQSGFKRKKFPMSDKFASCGCMFPFLSCFYRPSREEILGKQRSDEIDRQLIKDRVNFQTTHRLLLLGDGESGKSTIVKQMQLIHVKNFSQGDRIQKRADIRSNLQEAIVCILVAMKTMDPPIELEKPENAPRMEWILSHVQDKVLSPEFYENAKLLWKDRGVQAAYERSNEFQLIDSAKYFLDQIDVIKRDDYIPANQDIIRCREITSDIYELAFEVKNVKFQMIDVGGQRTERRKWFLCFNNVTAIIFVTACSSYDMVLREDPMKNRLVESLELFKNVWNNRWLKKISVILFLNKQDIFANKILSGKRQLEKYFPAFASFETPLNVTVPTGDPPELTRAKYFIRKEYEEICKYTDHKHRKLYPHFTCAVDTENVKRVFDDCRDSIQWKYLYDFNLL